MKNILMPTTLFLLLLTIAVTKNSFAEGVCKLTEDVARKAADGSLFNERSAVTPEEQRIWVRSQDVSAGKVTDMLEKRDLAEVSIPNGDGTFTTVKGRVTAVDPANNTIEIGGKKIPLRQDNGMVIKKLDEDGETVLNRVDFKEHPGLMKKVAVKVPFETRSPSTSTMESGAPAASNVKRGSDFVQIDQLTESEKAVLTRRLGGKPLTVSPNTSGGLEPSKATFLKNNTVHIVGEETNGAAVHGGQFNLGKYDPWVVLENDAGQTVKVRWDQLLNVTAH